MVSSVPPTVQPSPPLEQHHVDSKVDLSHSLPISSSSSSTLPGEILDSSNQVAKKKKNKTKKKKSDKREANTAAIVHKKPSLDKPSNLPQKFKFPCMLCKGDHFLRDYPGIPKVLKVWSDDHPSLPLASGSHIGGTSSTSNDKTRRKQGMVTNPCKLCEGHHPIHLCMHMDEAMRVLDNPTVSAPYLPVGY